MNIIVKNKDNKDDLGAIYTIRVLINNLNHCIKITYGEDFSDWLREEVVKQAYEDYLRLYK